MVRPGDIVAFNKSDLFKDGRPNIRNPRSRDDISIGEDRGSIGYIDP